MNVISADHILENVERLAAQGWEYQINGNVLDYNFEGQDQTVSHRKYVGCTIEMTHRGITFTGEGKTIKEAWADVEAKIYQVHEVWELL